MRWLVMVVIAGGCGRFGFGDAIDARVTYRDVVMADHPVAYWRLGDLGGTARDELGQLDGAYANGSLVGQPGALAGDPNTAVHFDGTYGEVSAADVLPFTGTAPFSLEVWVDEPSSVRYQHYITKETRISPGPDSGYALLQGPGTSVYVERCSIQMCSVAGHVAITTDTWTYLVGVYDGTTLTLYVDGQFKGAMVDSRVVPAYSTPVLLGAHINGANLDGLLDEAAIYDHALAADRIALHYQIGISGPQ